MATIGTLCKGLLRITLETTPKWTPVMTQVRCARFGPEFIEPLLDERELAKPLAEDDDRRYQKVKPANCDQTTLLSYDPLVSKFTNIIMRKGQKVIARTIVDKSFEQIKRIQLSRYHRAAPEDKDSIVLDPREVFKLAIENCTPVLKLQNIRKGGVVYSVPTPVTTKYAAFMAMRWLVESSKEKDRKMRMWEKLAMELVDASQNKGMTVRKKQELHKQCEANRAYAHFRWG